MVDFSEKNDWQTFILLKNMVDFTEKRLADIIKYIRLI